MQVKDLLVLKVGVWGRGGGQACGVGVRRGG